MGNEYSTYDLEQFVQTMTEDGFDVRHVVMLLDEFLLYKNKKSGQEFDRILTTEHI